MEIIEIENKRIGEEEENLYLKENMSDILPITERWEPLGADNDENTDSNFTQNTKYDAEQFVGKNLLQSASASIVCEQFKTDCEQHFTTDDFNIDTNRIKSLEEEQEILTTSLMALTSHFAQVQFRLRQIVEAEPVDRDKLLKNLEEFAFRGIPEITENHEFSTDDNILTKNILESSCERQFELIEHLKQQLTELEKFAYESGAPVLPQSVILEKQKIIIDELKNKLNLNVSDMDLPNLTHEDLRNQIDTAMNEFVGPLKMKEQLVTQLKTQITDLERFIAFLQYDEVTDCESHVNTIQNSLMPSTSTKNDENNKSPTYLTQMENTAYNSYSAKKKAAARSKLSTNLSEKPNNFNIKTTETEDLQNNIDSLSKKENPISLNKKAHNVLDKLSTILQIFVLSQIGCSSSAVSSPTSNFHKNTLKRNQYCNHWGDIRAQLEVDVQEILNLIRSLNLDQERIATIKLRKNQNTIVNDIKNIPSTSKSVITNQYRGNNNDNLSKKKSSQSSIPLSSLYSSVSIINAELTTTIRRNFACTLQKLIQHGLRVYTTTTNNLLVPFLGCFAPFTSISNSTGSNCKDDWINKGPQHQNYPRKTQSKSNSKNCDDLSENSSTYDNDIDQLSSTTTKTSSMLYDDDYNISEDCNDRQMHAWELILEYYKIKNGESYNDTPARKLSQSFNLDIGGSQATTNKESLLCAIANIITIHSPYKRSYNSHFKAFVCAALNSHKLVKWLCLLFDCSDLINKYYEPWSYVMRTGFRDALRTIDCLTQHNFDLPIDLAVRQFENIKDAF